MVIKTWLASVAIIFIASGSFAQDLEPISARPLMLPEPVELPNANLKSATNQSADDTPKSADYLVIFDIPLISAQKTVDINRLKMSNVNLGSVISPLIEDIRYDWIPIPEFNFFNKNINFGFTGGFRTGTDQGSKREVRYLNSSIDYSLWHFMAGGDGFIENENVPQALKGIEFSADFSRKSYGGRGWAGIKFGDFSRSFVSAKAGMGYIKTRGDKIYNYASVEPAESLSLYSEDFKIQSLAVEGRLLNSHLSEGVRLEGNYYQRILNSPDPYRFGKNEFADVMLQGSLEIIPSLKHDLVRFVVKGSRRFNAQIYQGQFMLSGNPDSLMFRNDPAGIQIYLRIAFR